MKSGCAEEVLLESREEDGMLLWSIIENTIEAQNKHGHMNGSDYYFITQKHIQALLDGKQLAANDGGCMHFFSMKKPE